jgi:hypothetical protein
MVEVVRAEGRGWTVCVRREMSAAEVKRIVGYRVGPGVRYELLNRGGGAEVTFENEADARSFARWLT